MPQKHMPPPVFPPFTPDTSRRRRIPEWLTRDLGLKDVILLALAILGAYGFVNPLRRISVLEEKVSGLEENSRFTNYLLCVQIRRNDPAGVPPGCAPVFEERKDK